MSEQYTYAVARIRALEVSLFSDSTIDQLIACQNYGQALQFLEEKGWGDAESSGDAEKILTREEEKTWEVVKELSIGMEHFDVLSYPKLFHNLKAAVKEVCTGDKNRHIYYEDVRIPGEEMRKIVEDRDFGKLPDSMRIAGEEAYETLLHTGDGQLCDVIIDRAALDAIYQAGKESPDSGEILLPHGWHAALLSPEPYVITWTNVRQNVAMASGVGKTPEERYEHAMEYVKLVGLEDYADLSPVELSTGMKQRLGIAMALLGSPKLLILDEPTNGLDPAGIQEMRSLISSMPETTGATVLISSHLLGEIEQMVTQVGILNHGKMLFEGSLQALQKHSRGGILLRVLDVPKSIAVLNRQGIRAVTQAQHPDVLELPALPDEALAALVSTLAENGVGVVGLTAQTKNLEEIFLSLTQNNGEVA